jgi:transcriptional regulator GlxA family with amidase domain
MRVEILMFDGVDELDVFGPFEALSGPLVTVRLVALDGPRTVTSSRGVQVGAEAPGEPDGIVVPGGGWLDGAERGTRAEVERGTIPAYLRSFAAGGGWVASVCTGAFLLGAAGLLAGREATTNTKALAALAGSAGRVVDGRVVDAGSVVTAQGPSAGIDLGLHLVERFLGSAAAEAHADGMDLTRTARTWYAARAAAGS